MPACNGRWLGREVAKLPPTGPQLVRAALGTPGPVTRASLRGLTRLCHDSGLYVISCDQRRLEQAIDRERASGAKLEQVKGERRSTVDLEKRFDRPPIAIDPAVEVHPSPPLNPARRCATSQNLAVEVATSQDDNYYSEYVDGFATACCRVGANASASWRRCIIYSAFAHGNGLHCAITIGRTTGA